MSNVVVTLFGSAICCIVPLAAFATGVYYARFGLPLSMRWRGFGRTVDDDD